MTVQKKIKHSESDTWHKRDEKMKKTVINAKINIHHWSERLRTSCNDQKSAFIICLHLIITLFASKKNGNVLRLDASNISHSHPNTHRQRKVNMVYIAKKHTRREYGDDKRGQKPTNIGKYVHKATKLKNWVNIKRNVYVTNIICTSDVAHLAENERTKIGRQTNKINLQIFQLFLLMFFFSFIFSSHHWHATRRLHRLTHFIYLISIGRAQHRIP